MTQGRRRVAIVQSNYVPWKGYFDLIAASDLFVLLDDVQYTRRDWRNRNRVKTDRGSVWLTVPVEVSGRYHQRIDETRISDPAWAGKHWDRIRQLYAPAPRFEDVAHDLEVTYRELDSPWLSSVNRALIERLCALLGITTPIMSSTELLARASDDATGRLVELCAAAGATEYVSGPAARGYLDEGAFAAVDVEVRWADYSGYPEYPQLHPPFDHAVTVIDLLANTGSDARSYMKGTEVVSGR